MNDAKTHKNVVLLTALVLVTMLSGCASQQPLSNFARKGDTVVVSLGGTTKNVQVPVLKKEDVAVSITDAAGTTHTPKLRNLFRVYADPTSNYTYSSTRSGTWAYSQAGAYQGQWMAVIDLVNPGTNQALPLAQGSASVQVSAAGLQSTASTSNGNLDDIPLTIIAGTGAPNPLNEEDTNSFAGINRPLNYLDPLPQIRVSPSPATPPAGSAIGGLNLVFSYNTSDVLRGPDIVPAAPDPNLQLLTDVENQGDGTTIVKAMLINPHGFNRSNTVYSDGTSPYRNLGLSIVLGNGSGITDQNWQTAVQVISAEYIDINGDPVADVTPVLSKER